MDNKHTQQVDFSNPSADKITSGTTNKPMEVKMSKETSIEFLLAYTKELPEYIKEYVIRRHNIEVRQAYTHGTRNGMKSYCGEKLMDPQDYYNKTFKGEEQ